MSRLDLVVMTTKCHDHYATQGQLMYMIIVSMDPDRLGCIELICVDSPLCPIRAAYCQIYWTPHFFFLISPGPVIISGP